MLSVRYFFDNTLRALKLLGFNVRCPDGGTTAFCFHKFSKQEIWVPKEGNGVSESVLKFIFEPIGLPLVYFKSVYSSLKDNNTHPSDQF